MPKYATGIYDDCPFCNRRVTERGPFFEGYRVTADIQHLIRGKGKFKQKQYFHKSCFEGCVAGKISW